MARQRQQPNKVLPSGHACHRTFGVPKAGDGVIFLGLPFNDTGRILSAFRDEILEAVRAALNSGCWLNGQRTVAFAEAFAADLGVPYCLPVANGSDALELALRALHMVRRPAGREVVTVANAGGYTVTACRQLGLVPVFADIDEPSQLLNTDTALAAMADETLAVVVTHLYGGIVDVPALRRAIDAAGFTDVPILEDCAQAHGATLNGRKVGTLGDIATFSFYPTKNLGAMGDAGAIVSADPDLFAVLTQLHQYGWSEKYRIAIPGGRNSRMDEVQAAILLTLLPHLSEMNRRRVKILETYRQAGGYRTSFLTHENGTVAHLAVALSSERERFRAHMKERGIPTQIHYPLLDCDQPGWARLPQRVGPKGLSTSKRSVAQIVTLPCFPMMTDGEISQILDALNEWNAHA